MVLRVFSVATVLGPSGLLNAVVLVVVAGSSGLVKAVDDGGASLVGSVICELVTKEIDKLSNPCGASLNALSIEILGNGGTGTFSTDENYTQD